MKTSLKKLRGLALYHHKDDRQKDRQVQPRVQSDELAKASEDMNDMSDCYDSLLSAAAAAANSAYEFSESLREMGVCLLQKISLDDDEETAKVLLLLGKTQFELQKLVDSYRSHINQTITVPSESLLNELLTVEDMKNRCDEKRELYEYMRAKYKEKGRSKSGKVENFSSQQVHAARDEFDNEATLFVFRLKSLKQGQSRSLLTQAARHHAAQLSFFRKALKSLEAVEPHVKSVTEQQHIDYHFTGLDDDELEDDDVSSYDDDSDSSALDNEGEISFDYRHNDHRRNFGSASRKLMKLDHEITFPALPIVHAAKENLQDSSDNYFSREHKLLSKSAPLFPQRVVDPAERAMQLRPSYTRKFHSYVLPTPGDTKSLTLTRSENRVSQVKTSSQHIQNYQHLVTMEPNKSGKLTGNGNFSGPVIGDPQSVLKDNNSRISPPLAERISFSPPTPRVGSTVKTMKRLSFSGPITSKPISTRPSLYARDLPQFSSGPIFRTQRLKSTSSPKVSPNTSPTFVSSLRISELHELPRPPAHLNNSSTRPVLVGFSAPLVSRGQESYTNNTTSVAHASPLPTPPHAGLTSSHLLSSSQRGGKFSPTHKQSGGLPSSDKSEGTTSPPLTPIRLSKTHPT